MNPRTNTQDNTMKVLDLALRFQDLNLNGSDLTVEVRRESPHHRRVTSVSITGRIVYPITKVVDAEFQFVIDIDRQTKSISSNVQATIIDHEEGDTIPAKMTVLGGVEAFQEAEAIANTLEALLTPEPPAEPTVKIYRTHNASHILMDIFDSVGHPLPEKWREFFLDGCSAWSSTPEDDRCNSGTITFAMSRRDARALRNRAHRAARSFINEFGEGYEEDELLERLRDDLDYALEALAA